ncbi:MAG: S9 family peptidase [Verrucomicrobiales bacterium]|nr:S9 family peptidase [Verrucomicrobiales bacterium]
MTLPSLVRAETPAAQPSFRALPGASFPFFPARGSRPLRWLATGLLIAFTSADMRAQDEATEAAPEPLTLDRVFSGEFNGGGYSARWIGDGAEYVRFETARAGHGRDLMLYDANSGEGRVLVPGHRFIPPGQGGPLNIDGHEFSTDRSKLLIYTNSRRVWRQNTRGDYWLLDIAAGMLTKLGGDGPPATMMFATFSPDGTRVAFVRANNLYVQRLSDLSITALTTDGGAHLINGTFDWVYEEELSLRNGYRWSPNGHRIAFWQIDTTGVPEFVMINDTDALYPTLTRFAYPKTGQINPAARIGVVAAAGGPVRWMEIPGDPRDHYLARLDWVEAPEELMIQQLNRLQNTNQVYLADPETGAAKPWFSDPDAAWIDVRDDYRWFDDHRRLLWVSERDGWLRAWAVSRKNGKFKPLTKGDLDVMEVLSVDEADGRFYFYASPENATQRYLYSASINGGKVTRLTPEDQPGWHSYSVSGDARLAVHTRSRFAEPSAVDLVSLPGHEPLRVLEDNAKQREKLAQLAPTTSEFFRVDIGDGVELDGWCIKPPDFDEAKRYPVLFHVYGEPAGQTVLDRWGGRNAMWHRMLAEQGYVVISLDNRGTPAPRGREWRKCIYRQVGILASGDQAAGLRALRERWSWLDGSRVGIWGWSGGGSMTLNAVFRHPDLYHVGMAVAAVPNMRLYDTIYQERYMGLPADNVEGYRLGSPITFAGQLEGDLLLVHGTGDDNVHYQGMELLVDELVAHGKPFTMMAYPNRSHGIGEGPGTSRHLYELLTRFLKTHLPAGGREPAATPAGSE